MSSWIPLKRVATVIPGQSPPSHDVSDSDGSSRPFLQGNKEFGTLHPEPRFQSARAPKQANTGDILLSVRAPVGALNIADRPYGIGRGLCAIRPQSGLTAAFAWWALVATVPRLSMGATGSTYQAINADDVGQLRVPCLSYSDQHAIANYLEREIERVDALIAAKRAMTGLVEERLETQLLKLLNPQDSENKLIPIRRVLRKEARAAAAPGVVTAFRDGVVCLRERRRQAGYTEASTRSDYQGIRRGDVVFHGLDGFAGAIGVSEDNGICTPVYHVCSTRPGFDSMYVALTLRALALSGYLALQSGNVRERAVDFRNWDALARIPIPVPPIDRQRTVAREYTSRRSWANHLSEDVRRQIGLLLERRQALITDAVTGQVDIPEIA